MKNPKDFPKGLSYLYIDLASRLTGAVSQHFGQSPSLSWSSSRSVVL